MPFDALLGVSPLPPGAKPCKAARMAQDGRGAPLRGYAARMEGDPGELYSVEQAAKVLAPF